MVDGRNIKEHWKNTPSKLITKIYGRPASVQVCRLNKIFDYKVTIMQKEARTSRNGFLASFNANMSENPTHDPSLCRYMKVLPNHMLMTTYFLFLKFSENSHFLFQLLHIIIFRINIKQINYWSNVQEILRVSTFHFTKILVNTDYTRTCN